MGAHGQGGKMRIGSVVVARPQAGATRQCRSPRRACQVEAVSALLEQQQQHLRVLAAAAARGRRGAGAAEQ